MRPSVKCPICGDHRPFVLWIDDEPPTECPMGPQVKTVTDCSWQMDDARMQAERRKQYPEAYDENGNMRPDGWAIIAALDAAEKWRRVIEGLPATDSPRGR